MSKTIKVVVLSLVAAGSLLGATVAKAGVAWSVDVGVPGVAVGVGNRPVYRPVQQVYVAPPVVYAPVPVYAPAPVYRPAPVYAPPVVQYAPAPIGYYEAPRYYRPAPVVVYPEYRHGWQGWKRWHDGRGDRDHDHDHGRDGDGAGRWDGHR